MPREASLAKITRPSLLKVYLRKNFFNILDKCREKPAISLIAPQGSGKTTLISSYIESRGLKCLWYQIDAADKDPASFFHFLGIAAQNAAPGKMVKLPHLTPEFQSGIHAFTKEYFSRLYKALGKNSLIIFDNYHELPAESILHELIRYGLEEIPEGTNVVLMSRKSLPPVLSRIRLSQLMEVITWDELRLTAEEIAGIASQRSKEITDNDSRKILASTEGWAAGLVLMLDSLDERDFPSKAFDKNNPGMAFNRFAEELFTKFSPEVRDFLLKTAVPPVITVEMAEELTGNKKASAIISELMDMNYFIQSLPGEETCFQYHNLFRDFLLTRLKKDSSVEELTDIERKAARLLAEAGRIDDAIGLYQCLADWDIIIPLLLKEAPLMLAQGRHQTLREWLESLPEHLVEKNAWLLYLNGSCHLPFDQHKSRCFFEKAFDAFCSKKDPSGIFPSWCGVVEAVIHGFDDLKRLDRWIDSLDALLAEHTSFPSKEIEYRVSLSMFMALSFRAPQHPDINIWVDKTCRIMEEVSDPDLIAPISLYLVDYFLWTGNMEKADLIVEKTARAIHKKSDSPMTLIASKLTEALNHWYHGRLQSCLEAVSEGLKTAETKGVNVFNYFLFGHGAIGSLTGGDIKNAEKYLKQMASVLDTRKRLCASYYHHVAACCKLLKKDLSGALEHEGHSLELAVKVGSSFGEAMSGTGLALLHYELCDRKKAASEIAKARVLAIQAGSVLVEFVSYVFEAYFDLDSGDRKRAAEKLKIAFSLGRKRGFVNFHMWRPDIMARLCLLALDEGIEVDYARSLIMERGLFPEEPPLQTENWPWRLKICTLGRFHIFKDGVSLEFSKKAPRKTLDLLKLLIALGGKDVPESKILDTLWQDVDGDAAHAAFKTSLNRLRHLLGFEDAIQLRNGRMTINTRYCWVDVMAFEHLIKLAEARKDATLDNGSIDLLNRSIELYRSGPNIDFEDSKWSLMFNERIKSMFVRTVIKLGSYLEKAGKNEEAIECYKKGIENEPLSEKLYQSLMVCLDRHGHKGEALALYKRMTKIFSEVLGAEPSAKTKQIYRGVAGR